MSYALALSPMTQLAPFTASGEWVAFDVGPDGLVYLLLALAPLDYHIEQTGWAIFPKTIPEHAQSYRLLVLERDQVILDMKIEQEEFNIHHVQPLGDELLLVCARSHYATAGGPEENGRVYTRDGIFKRSILLGDGIQSVQTTSDGTIWTSYFDEGVFGNFGWNEPVGASGLVAWDALGRKLYEFEPTLGLGSICDCYALNVPSDDDVWFYYYTEFPLVHLHRRTVHAFWQVPVGGSDAFAVLGDYALFRGGYSERDTYHLFHLGNDGNTELIRTVELTGENGELLTAERVVGRADAIFFVSQGQVYRIDVETVAVGDGSH